MLSPVRFRPFLSILLAMFAWPVSAHDLPLGSTSGFYSLRTSTLKDYRYREVIVQQRDFSCGSAALATLLTYHYNHPVSEAEVLQKMYAAGDKKKIEKEGFSLLDMKSYLSTIGIQAEGFKESLDKLVQVHVPAIALINFHGYLHFVLIRGVTKEKVLIADPTNGMRTVDRDEFEAMWNNILFVFLSDMPTGRQHFNLAKHWGHPLNRHELHEAVAGQDLAPMQLHLTRQPGYF